MDKVPDELKLAESYQFQVKVENNGTHFAGELNLTPEGCSLIVRGDIIGERTHTFEWADMDEMRCDSFEGTFILRGLEFSGGANRSLQRYPQPAGHFEIRYEVSHAMFFRGQRHRIPSFVGFVIRSPSIDRWVGLTTTQDAIIAAWNANNLFSGERTSPHEFLINIPNIGDVVTGYQLTAGSLERFSVGLRFRPAFGVTFDERKSASETIDAVSEMDTLLSFLLGYALTAEDIQLRTDDGYFLKSSLYRPRRDRKPLNTERLYEFFPLGHNLRHDQLGLPPLPIDVFPHYLGLPASDREYLKKYLRYRQLENPEERFLGFFRLLEKLCFQKASYLPEGRLQLLLDRAKPFLIKHFGDKSNVNSMLKRLPHWNRSKLNTESCVRRFMKGLPADTLARWIYSTDDLTEICKLRNDLTHANEVEPDTTDIERKSKFIEVVLVIRLLIHIGVSLPDAASISVRLQHHDMIAKRRDHLGGVVTITTSESDPNRSNVLDPATLPDPSHPD